jgi:hypothetical protein
MDPCVVVEAPVDYLVAGEGGRLQRGDRWR